jgi:hypothetical protein
MGDVTGVKASGADTPVIFLERLEEVFQGRPDFGGNIGGRFLHTIRQPG